MVPAAAISALTFIWCSKKAARCGADGAKCGGMKWAMEFTTIFSAAATELFEDGGGKFYVGKYDQSYLGKRI